ncbi:hypothetical protein ACKWTF_000441 [Chironomus riparius]
MIPNHFTVPTKTILQNFPSNIFYRVRIHVPVKHHTHVITKTQVKTVHIGVPIKEKPKKHGWDSSWAYSKKSKRFRKPPPMFFINY